MTTGEADANTPAAPSYWRRHAKWWIGGAAVLVIGLVAGAIGFFRSPAGVAAVRPNRWPGSDPALRTPDKLRVLFIGNSFTQYNGGIALIMRQLAASAGKTPVPVFDQYTVWGQTWQNLWNNSQAPEAIAEGRWDFVVLQDYSIAPLIYRDEMDEYGQVYSDAIKKVGAKPVFFMTWARMDELPTQETISDAYIDVANDNDAAVAPVGFAFNRVRFERPDVIVVQTEDGKHPTAAGSYLAACIFYSLFYHQSPVGLTPRISEGTKIWIDLKPDVAVYLQTVAWETVRNFKTRPMTTQPTSGV